MNTNNHLLSDVVFISSVLLLALVALRIEDKGILIKSFAPQILILGLCIVSVLFTSSGETVIARFFNLRYVVLFILASGVVYSIALSINNKADGSVYISNALIAFAWNAFNSLATGLLGVMTEPRFAYAPLKVKFAFGLTIFLVVLTVGISNYINTELEKLPQTV